MNISDPGYPQLIAGLLLSGTQYGIDVQDNFAYLASGLEGLTIVDLSTPNLFEMGSVDTFGMANRVKVVGKTAFVAGRAIDLIAVPESGLTIIDVSIPSHPEVISRLDTTPKRGDFYSGGSFDVDIVGTLAFLSTDIIDSSGRFLMGLLQVVDITDLKNPKIIANAKLPDRAREVVHLGFHSEP